MLRYLFLSVFLFILSINSAAAIDVVYPSSRNAVINASNTFVFGNVQTGSRVFINGNPVKLWDESFFVEIVNLDYGKNNIVFSEIKDGKKEDIIYSITRNKPSTMGGAVNKIAVNTFPADEIWYSKTVKDNAVVREKPSSSGKRSVELGENVVLYLNAKYGDYYKINTLGDGEFWIHKSNIDEPRIIKQKMQNVIKQHTRTDDENYVYEKFQVTYPVFYTVNQIDNSLKIKLFGINSGNFEYSFDFNYPLLSYECFYEDNKFVLKTAKKPNIADDNVLSGINIFIDAGHGGKEKGAVGPTRINEKDINLAIANKLVVLLRNDGANVSYSRTDDRQVGLYERVKMARDNNALISVSIHNNSLPNGKNPYEQHGTEVHYYNENAKLLAKIININLVQDLNLKNNGIHKSSFALNRSTNPISVLVELAYMINPEEYILLNNPDFQNRAAQSIEKSLKQYINLLNQKVGQ